jgi:predicted DNA-binding transcriptional regulator YafY
MAFHKQYQRCRTINGLLKNSKSATLEEMISACEFSLGGERPSQRTIEGDLSIMRREPPDGYGAPIIYDRGKERYRYTDPNFSIDGIPLDREELDNLVFAATILNQYKDITYFNNFKGSIQKIVDVTNHRRMQLNEAEFDFIDFEKSPETIGYEHLQTIIDNIRESNVIKVTYQSFKREGLSEYILHPHYLKEYRGRWYVLGHDEKGNFERTVALDRIKRIITDENRHYRKSHIDFKSFFQDFIGIMKEDGEPEEIIVAFTKWQFQYALTQPIHHSQTVLDKSDDQERVYVKYHLIPNFEFLALLLGWKDQVEVISPERYREEIKGWLEKIKQVYSKTQKTI